MRSRGLSFLTASSRMSARVLLTRPSSPLSPSRRMERLRISLLAALRARTRALVRPSFRSPGSCFRVSARAAATNRYSSPWSKNPSSLSASLSSLPTCSVSPAASSCTVLSRASGEAFFTAANRRSRLSFSPGWVRAGSAQEQNNPRRRKNLTVVVVYFMAPGRPGLSDRNRVYPRLSRPGRPSVNGKMVSTPSILTPRWK